MNGGTCINDAERQSFTCACRSGFTGDRCLDSKCISPIRRILIHERLSTYCAYPVNL